MIEVDKLIEHAEAFGEGMKQGKELAIKNYDKLFLELYQKMEDIEFKLDCFIAGFEKLGKIKFKPQIKDSIADKGVKQ